MSAQVATVQEIMSNFAVLTGLTGDAERRRYLWTDAFAVCNYLELHRQTEDRAYLALALELVDQVHHVLGRHRPEGTRSGWISGLDETEGEKHPTRGGLRIGKKLPERQPGETYDQQLEWDREGQYYHYLTKWMHSLNRVSQVTGDPRYNRWARELAQAVHAAFVYKLAGEPGKRMYWKMSVDLSRPLVPSMGHHDPLDGYLTYLSLQATGATLDSPGPDLTAEIADVAAISTGKEWATDDALGLGGLLTDAYRAERLISAAAFNRRQFPLELLDAALVGLHAFERQNSLRYPVSHRLAFRELGLAIGLHALERLREATTDGNDYPGKHGNWTRRLESLLSFLPLAGNIESFWLNPTHREAPTWSAHREINMVMLATSLAPNAYLTVLENGTQ